MNYPKEETELQVIVDWAEQFRPRKASKEKPDENSRVIYWDGRCWLGSIGSNIYGDTYWFPAPPPPQEPTALDRLWESATPETKTARQIGNVCLSREGLQSIIDAYEKVRGETK